jgi:acetyl esterase/lipase
MYPAWILLLALLLLSACPSRKNYYGHRDAADIQWDVSYLPQSKSKRHTLDLYLPKNKSEPSPLVIFVHGGMIKPLDKREMQWLTGLHGVVGANLTQHNIAVAVIDYRQYGEIATYQDALQDVLSATRFAKENAEQWKVDPTKIFLVGHSFGAFLTARLAFDAAQWQQAGISQESIRGFVSIAGTYDLEHLKRVAFAKKEKVAKKVTELAGDKSLASYTINNFVTPSHPPFLMMVGLDDDPALVQQHQDLKPNIDPTPKTTTIELTGESHMSVLLRMGTKKDQVTAPLLKFINDASN